MNNFKRTKFRTASDTFCIIREAASVPGCPVLFRVSGIDLSTLESMKKFIDFDQESDDILKDIKIEPGTEQVFFEWVGSGFHRM